MNEIEVLTQAFKSRWKYHNISILIGTGFLILCIILIGLTLYTMMSYTGNSKLLCTGIELLMALTARKLYKNITPTLEEHLMYLNEHHQLKLNIALQLSNLIKSQLSIKHTSDTKK